jgi:restriction endonuclease S subunit
MENHNLINGENLFISHRGNGDFRPIKYYKGECYYSDLLTLLKPKIEINIKFAYYFLKFNQKYIEENYQKGACNKTLDFALFNKMKIPVPPIEVQNLIVKELDSMYKQKESLQNANNEMNNYRKVQFEMLLSKCKESSVNKMDKLLKVSQGEYVKKESMEEGIYPIYGGGDASGLINKYNRESEYVISKDGVSLKCVRFVEGKFFLNHHAWSYEIIDKNISNKFVKEFDKKTAKELYSINQEVL